MFPLLQIIPFFDYQKIVRSITEFFLCMELFTFRDRLKLNLITILGGGGQTNNGLSLQNDLLFISLAKSTYF